MIEGQITHYMLCANCKHDISDHRSISGNLQHCAECPCTVFQHLKPEMVDHPKHYNTHPSGVECITIIEHMIFNVGNAIKYLWRADEKGDPIENLEKAAWYINREIQRRKGK